MDVCAPYFYANLTNQVSSCVQGFDLCTVCGGTNACLDCNNIPFGSATQTQCQEENYLAAADVAAVGLTVNGTNPKGVLQVGNSTGYAFSPNGGPFPAILQLTFSSLLAKIGGVQTAVPLNTNDYQRVVDNNATTGVRCLNFQKIVLTASLLTVTQCIYSQDTVVTFGGVSFVASAQSLKLSVGLSGFQGLNSSDYVDVVFDWTLLGDYGQASGFINGSAPGQPAQNANTSFITSTLLTNVVYVQQSYLNFALFDGIVSSSQFQLSLSSSTNQLVPASNETITFRFQGPFQFAQYDPEFRLLVNPSYSSSESSRPELPFVYCLLWPLVKRAP